MLLLPLDPDTESGGGERTIATRVGCCRGHDLKLVALHTPAILKAFDFKALPVDVVMVECSYRAEQLQGLMDQKGFLRQARAHGDYVFLSRRATGVCGAPAPTRGGRPPGVARTYTRPEPKEVEEIDF